MADLIIVHEAGGTEEILLNREHVIYARRPDSDTTVLTLRDGKVLMITANLAILRNKPQ